MISHERDGSLLYLYIGNKYTVVVRWFRRCPVGCTRHYNRWEPEGDKCWFCQDERYIPWYCGWIKQARAECAYRLSRRKG